ncbi:hypothetical protein AB6A40_001400 [Gnathostoma spinigerum]|uniref:Hyaluronidase n=1 Tax=Gnathostoma spinigerum TaxID=75299 RepID=A0ABD6E5D0_9BILA
MKTASFLAFYLQLYVGFTFEVIWNVPSEKCSAASRFPILLENFNIKHNTDQKFYGDEVVLLYSSRFGRYPYYENYDKTKPVNGGLPQKANLTTHLEQAQKDIISAIPNETFDGIAVIDFEEWRPTFDTNWSLKRVYREQSIDDVKRRFPSMGQQELRMKAKEEFDMAAKNFMLESLWLGKKLRPMARWGFYGFPLCNYDAGANAGDECKNSFREHNNRLSFLFKSSDALFPSIYLTRENAFNRNYVRAVLKEAKRVAHQNEWSKQIYAYTKFEYHEYNIETKFYTKDDLCNTIGVAKEQKLDGVLLWSTSEHMSKRCERISDYVSMMLGPFIDACIVRNSAFCCQ